MSQITHAAPIHSSFAADEDLGALIEMFVEEIPLRIEALLVVAQVEDWENVRRIAHQLKGAGGSYGFQLVTDVAARLEQLCREQEAPAAIVAAIEELVQTCQRLRSGTPD